MIKFNGVNHLAMATGDMDKTIRFWRDLLGMRLVAGLGGPGYRHYFFQISEHDLLAFFEWPGVEPIAEKDHGAPYPGPSHSIMFLSVWKRRKTCGNSKTSSIPPASGFLRWWTTASFTPSTHSIPTISLSSSATASGAPRSGRIPLCATRNLQT